MSELLQICFVGVTILVFVSDICVGDFTFSKEPLTMMEARTYCQERGRILPNELTMKELNLLRQERVANGWLGLTRTVYKNWTSTEGALGNSSAFKQNVKGMCGMRETRRKSFSAKSCYDKLKGFLCSSRDCDACRVWNCINLKDQKRCITAVFGYTNWFDARRECEIQGKTLWAPSLKNFPTISVNKLFDLLSVSKTEYADIWVGWSLENWISQPGDQTNEQSTCVSFSTGNNNMWIRKPCTDKLPAVCQVLRNAKDQTSTEKTTEHLITPNTNACAANKEAVYHGLLGVFFLMGCLTVCCFNRIRTCKRIKTKQRSLTSQRDSASNSSTIYSQPHNDGVVLRNSARSGSGYAVVNKIKRNSSHGVKSWSPITECERSEIPAKGMTLQPNQLQASSNSASVYAVADSVPSAVLIHEEHEFSMDDQNVRPPPHRPITGVPNGGMAAAFQCGVKAFTQELSQKFAEISVATNEEGTAL